MVPRNEGTASISKATGRGPRILAGVWIGFWVICKSIRRVKMEPLRLCKLYWPCLLSRKHKELPESPSCSKKEMCWESLSRHYLNERSFKREMRIPTSPLQPVDWCFLARTWTATIILRNSKIKISSAKQKEIPYPLDKNTPSIETDAVGGSILSQSIPRDWDYHRSSLENTRNICQIVINPELCIS